MTVVKQGEAEGYIQRRLGQVNGLLLHGNDAAAVHALVQAAVRVVAGDDPFSEMTISPSDAVRDPALLMTEFRSQSLMGGRRIIVLRDCGDELVKVMQPVLDDPAAGNFILLTADALGKTSKLRKACEEAAKFASCALYEEGPEQLVRRVEQYLSAHGLNLPYAARERFFALAGDDRGSVMMEAEKLSLYAHGQKDVSVADVEAICGDSASFDADQLIDRVMEGDSEAADRIYGSLATAGTGRGLLPMLNYHVQRLQALVLDMASGAPFEQAFRSARPIFFFSRKGTMLNQTRIWDLDGLLEAQSAINAAVLRTRELPALEEAITGRCLLAVARQARLLRLRGA